MDIYLWGPAASGKTWLLNALIRHINLMEVALRKEKSPFDLWMEDVLDHRVSCSELESKATTDIDYVSYTLKRRYNIAGESNPSLELIQLACTHDHQISMLDGPGDVTTGELLITNNNEENRAKVLSAQTRLKSAQYLIIAINGGIEHSGGTQKSIGKIYSDCLQRLINLNPADDQKVYLCFTKIDKYLGTAATAEAMLALLFENNANKIESQLRDLMKIRQEPLPAYFISSSGYYTDMEGSIKPNITSEGTLADPTAWRPYKVCEPFFNIFDDGEKRTILNTPISEPIDKSFPLIPSLKNKLNTRLINNERKDLLNSHVSYHNMVDPSKIY
jgi:Type IV secretory pathway, VirB11 components, and related ATPases involved in archaeal flagella biosynthesis